LIETRLKLAQAIDQTGGPDGSPQEALPAKQGETCAPENLTEVRSGMVAEVRRFVMGLDISSFIVRGHLRLVDAWQAEDAP
jgi:type I restriction enzyme R subunit